MPTSKKHPPKATTLRLDPALQQRLALLQQVLKVPANKLISEAVEEFIDRRSAVVERDLERVLAQIKAVRKKDPEFGAAIAAFAEAEIRHVEDDPAEGQPVLNERGPSRRKVRSLLSSR